MKLTPVIHPAAIQRNRWQLEPAQQAYLARIKEHDLHPPMVDITRPPANSALYPSVERMELFHKEATQLGYLSCDIEAAGPHIICVGFTAFAFNEPELDGFEVGSSVCLRFRVRGGARYWSGWRDHLAAVGVLHGILADPSITKAFHNGITFDVPELEDLGFEVAGRLIDTMHLAHCCYPEMSKGLQFCSTLYLGMPVWKTLVDEEDEGVEEKG